MAWNGRYLKPCRVIYVAGEGYAMFYNRRLAWFKHNDIEPENDGLDVVQGAVDLTNEDEVRQFITEMQQDCEGVGLVVFDTLSTCIAGQNESDSSLISTVIQHARLISDALNSTVLFVHHPGKDEGRGARGSSALKGNIDFELHLTREGLNCTLDVTKQKDSEDGQKIHYVGTKTYLNRFDDDGFEMSSMAFIPLSIPTSQAHADARGAADLRSIVMAMNVGEPLSVNQLAKKLSRLHIGGIRSLTDRITAAVPLEWTRTKQGELLVSIRRIAGKGTTVMIEMNAVNCKPEMAF
jgi:hypothetical protein